MQEEQIVPDSKKYRNQKAIKQNRITVQLVAENSVEEKLLREATEDQRISSTLQLKIIHLEWLNIRKIENLQVFSNLTVLYLQHNKIAKIQNLECLINLEYLALNDNQISTIQNVAFLKKLVSLNLMNNTIEEIEPGQLPKSIQMLNLKNNPVAVNTDYKITIIKQLKNLQTLDGITVAPEQKLKIIGKFPQRLLAYSENLKHFRTKQQIKKQLDQQTLPIYLGGTFDEQQTLKDVREKTRKHMHMAKEGFAADMKDQNQNFEQKIKISRKIRDFKQSEAKKRKQQNQIRQAENEDKVDDDN